MVIIKKRTEGSSTEVYFEQYQGKLRFLNYITGKVTTTSLIHYFIIMFVISNIFLYISYILYPPELHYTILTHNMSHLGNPYVNPGWFFFSISLWCFVLTIYGPEEYLRRNLDHYTSYIKDTTRFFFNLAAFLLFLVGLLPDTQDYSLLQEIHIWVASFSFACFQISAFMLWLRGRKIFTSKIVKYYMVFHYSLLFLMLTTQIYVKIKRLPFPAPGILSFPIYEWALFYSYFLLIFTMVRSIPPYPHHVRHFQLF